MAIIPEIRKTANAWMRQGNTGAMSNAISFLDETLSILDKKKVGLIRCDISFYGNSYGWKWERES